MNLNEITNSKSAVLVANGKFEYHNVKLGNLPPDHCRIKIKAVGICSSDISRAFNWCYFYPLVMGHEIAGEMVLWIKCT